MAAGRTDFIRDVDCKRVFYFNLSQAAHFQPSYHIIVDVYSECFGTYRDSFMCACIVAIIQSPPAKKELIINRESVLLFLPFRISSIVT